MVKWGKKSLIGFMVCSLFLLSFSGCGKKAITTSEKASKGPVVLKFYFNGAANTQKPENEKVHKYILDKTGYDVQVENIPDNNYDQKMKLTLASQDVFDGMGTIPLTYSWVDLKNKKLILPLNDLLDKYGQNLKKEYGKNLSVTTDSDGKIWGLPRVMQETMFLPGIREDWLQKLNMKMPTSLKEFEIYLDAVSKTDLNGNGKHDEIPYCPWWTLWGFRLSMGPAFLGVNGVNYLTPDNKIMPIYMHPLYKSMLETLNKWYDKGWMYKEFATQSDDKKTELMKAGLIGSMNQWWFGGDATLKQGIKYSPMSPWTDAPGGIKGWGSNPSYDPNFAISSTSKHPEDVMKFANWVASDPANQLTLRYGIEGTDWKYTDSSKKSIEMIDGYTDRYLAFYNIFNFNFDDISLPIHPVDAISTDIARVKNISKDWTGLPDTQHLWPFSFTGTAAENVGTDGDTMINEAILKTIYGQQSINQWDATVKQYMSIQGTVVSQVQTEQWKKSFSNINPYASIH
ncbi:MAG TPA: extracellular solute-binding protein [Ruminiclostridium sp.]